MPRSVAAQTRTLTPARARRIAIAAAGLSQRRPNGRVDVRHARRVVERLGAVQIDSVNVVARAHELAVFSRLGPHPTDLLDRLAYDRREVFECWLHEASFAPVEVQPLLRPRMRRRRQRPSPQEAALFADEPGYVAAVEREIAEAGPLSASALDDPGRADGPWWGWSKGKVACEYLFATGRLAVAARRGFTRVYDLSERVLPAQVLATPTPSNDDADRALLQRAARALGVATAADLADHPRMAPARARALLPGLVAAGDLEAVEVRGWPEPAYLHPGAVAARPHAAALVSPFDPMVWCRPRIQRLFDFHYRLEIYTPAKQRVHGYYVLPFVLGDRIAARVDLKAERDRGRLRVRAAWHEREVDEIAVARALATQLAALASHLGLTETIVVDEVGDLSAALAAACRGSSHDYAAGCCGGSHDHAAG